MVVIKRYLDDEDEVYLDARGLRQLMLDNAFVFNDALSQMDATDEHRRIAATGFREGLVIAADVITRLMEMPQQAEAPEQEEGNHAKD